MLVSFPITEGRPAGLLKLVRLSIVIIRGGDCSTPIIGCVAGSLTFQVCRGKLDGGVEQCKRPDNKTITTPYSTEAGMCKQSWHLV